MGDVVALTGNYGKSFFQKFSPTNQNSYDKSPPIFPTTSVAGGKCLQTKNLCFKKQRFFVMFFYLVLKSMNSWRRSMPELLASVLKTRICT